MTDIGKKIFQKIRKEIDVHLNEFSFFPHNRDWYSGITNNLPRRLSQHKKNNQVIGFKCWDAETFDIAHALEKYCNEKGFCNDKRKGGANQNSHFFYIYKKKVSTLESIVTKVFNKPYNNIKPRKIKLRSDKNKKNDKSN
jgi:hypothetical protein